MTHSHRFRLRRALLVPLFLAAFLLGLILSVTMAAAAYDLASITPHATVPPPTGPAHTVRTGNVLTRYEQWGTRGPVLLLIPGFIESSFVWHPVARLLAAHFRVYAPDVRGFGYTTHRPPYTLSADVDQMTDFVHALHLDPAHGVRPLVLGHSSGAAIAADLALRHPTLVAGLIMLDGDGTASGAGPRWQHALIVDPYYTAVYRLFLNHVALARYIWNRVCGPACPPFSGAIAAGWLRPLEVPGAKGALKEIVESPLIALKPAQLARIRVPSAVVLGSSDPTITVSRAETLAGWLHTNLLVTIPNARHLPMVSAPRLFAHDMVVVTQRLESVS